MRASPSLGVRHAAGHRATPARPGPGPEVPDGVVAPAAVLRPLGWGFGLLGAAVVLSMVGLASVVNLAVPVAAVVVALYLLATGRHLAYIHLVLVLWMFAPGLRRIVDWQSGFHESSPVLLAAPAVSLLGVLFTRFRTARVAVLHLALVTTFGAALLYGLVAGVLVSGPAAALLSFSGWGPPFVLGLYLTFFPGDLARVARRVADASWVYLGLLGGYGVVQWVVAPVWDTTWMTNVAAGGTGFTFGEAEPFGIRVFSLLNAPYAVGCTLVILIVTQVGLRTTPWRVAAVAVGVASLGLCSVRAAWLVLVLAIVLLAVRGRIPPRWAAGAALTTVLAIALAPDSFTSTVGDRFDSLGSGSSDASASARSDFYSTVVPRLLADPTGRGLGSTGAGVRAQGAAGTQAFGNVDSTYIDLLRTYGTVLAVVVVALLVVTVVASWVRFGGERSLLGPWTALAAVMPVLALLGDALASVNGVFLWFALSVCARERDEWDRTGDAVHDDRLRRVTS